MSDSFADLWSTTAPLPPKPKPQTLSAVSSSSSTLGNTANAPQGNRGYSAVGAPKKDVFSMLAGSSTPTPRYGSGPATTSAPHSRSLTPSHPSYTSATSSNTNPTRPAAHQTFSSPVSKTNSSSTLAGDAFGDLFASASGAASSVSNTGNMTLAARLALESQQRTRSSSPGGATTMSRTDSTGSAWAGLDALGGGGGLLATPVVTSKPVGNVKVDDVDDWGLGDFGSATTTMTTTTSSNSTANARKVPPTNGAQKTTTTTIPKSLWDLDEFTSNSNSNPTGIGRSHSDSPSTHPHPHKNAHKPKIASVDEPFDFGGREDRVDEERRHRHGEGKRRGLLDLSDEEEEEDGFGGGQDGGYMRHGEPEDDILGVLSGPPRPAQPNASTSLSNSTSSSRAPAQTKTNPNRPISPPPHILGQIVEMGFSVSQARKALAETSTGVDVEQALESLLSGGGGGGNNIGATEERNGNSRTQNAVEEPIPPRPRGAPKGQKERERERLERQRAAASSPSGSTNSIPNPTVSEIQDQASELLSQASEIGLSVFNKASAMWGKGREKVVKAYEERGGVVGVVGHLGVGGGAIGRGRGEGGDGGGTWGTRGVGERGGQGRGGARVDGRPRWMQEVIGTDEEDGQGGGGFRDEHERGAFADDHDHGDHDESNQRAETPRTPEEEPTALFDAGDEEVDLFAPAPPAPRVTASASTSTQPPPQRTQRQPPAQRQSTQPRRPQPQQPQQIRQRPSSPPIPPRTLPSASASSLSTALTHKTTGTASFKLGQYASSVSSYTSALESLPEGHLLKVPLYTNRAVARMKVGEYGGAEEDCKRALGIVRGLADEGVNPDGNTTDETIASLTWTPNSLPQNLRTPNSTSAWTHPQGLGVDLSDGYIKALKRRAECLEAREKWPAAMRDWEVLCGCGAWVGERVRAEAGRARARCRGMIEGSSSTTGGTGAVANGAGAAPARPKPTARPKPKPSSTPQPPSKALAALQSTTAALEADDALRHSLKDTVDARLLSWKSGKETNIRALLCSLDAVLWDGVLDGVKVKGLGDVVSPAQVKKAYVRVVGRVHPDKLNASNSNVEQRMLANGVFGTLNEAWIAFQAGPK